MRSIVAHDVPGSGKFYAEIVPSATFSTATFIGIAAASINMNNVGAATNAGLYNETLRADGQTAGMVSGVATGLAYAGGDVIGVAYDAGAALVWFNKNNGAWQGNGAGNPAAGTNGLAVAPGNWPMMLYATHNNAAGSFTLYDYAAVQHYAAPAGFTAWAIAPATAGPRQSLVM
jgi:hypothetical protein